MKGFVKILKCLCLLFYILKVKLSSSSSFKYLLIIQDPFLSELIRKAFSLLTGSSVSLQNY